MLIAKGSIRSSRALFSHAFERAEQQAEYSRLSPLCAAHDSATVQVFWLSFKQCGWNPMVKESMGERYRR